MPQALVPVFEAIGYALISNGVAAGITVYGAASVLAAAPAILSTFTSSRA